MKIIFYFHDRHATSTSLVLYVYNINTALITERDERIADASIFGAELKKCIRLYVNDLRRRDLYEKRIIFINLHSQKCFLMYKSMPVQFIFLTPTNELLFVAVAFCPNRPFHKKLSLGTENASHLKANNLLTFVEERSTDKEQSPDLNLCN